jgi:hypothetical protein
MNKRRRKYNGQNPLPHGRPAVLSQREEASVAEAIIVAATWGYPFTTLEVREFVKKYFDRKGVVERRFNNNLPGRDWTKAFLKRHVELNLRLIENL